MPTPFLTKPRTGPSAVRTTGPSSFRDCAVAGVESTPTASNEPSSRARVTALRDALETRTFLHCGAMAMVSLPTAIEIALLRLLSRSRLEQRHWRPPDSRSGIQGQSRRPLRWIGCRQICGFRRLASRGMFRNFVKCSAVKPSAFAGLPNSRTHSDECEQARYSEPRSVQACKRARSGWTSNGWLRPTGCSLPSPSVIFIRCSHRSNSGARFKPSRLRRYRAS